MRLNSIGRPDSTEYLPYFDRYIRLVPESDILMALANQVGEMRATLNAVGADDEITIHPPYQWSLRQVVGHVVDTERVFAYRALRFSVADETPLSGFDQDAFVACSNLDTIPLRSLTEELCMVRESNVLMMSRFPAGAWQRSGIASGNRMTVRAIAYVLVGHTRHHLRIIDQRLSGGAPAPE